MESFNWPQPEYGAGDEVLRESRQRLLSQAQDSFEMASALTDMHEGVYVSREPLAVAGHEDALSILLTRDGERPFVDEEDKEYIKLYFMQAEFRNDDTPEPKVEDDLVWVEEHRGQKKQRYLLTEYSFQPYLGEVEHQSDGEYSTDTSSEASELRRFRERLDRFKLTPYK